MRVSTCGALLFGVVSATALAQSNLGCNKDSDCKGDRICISGQCVDAPSAGQQSPSPPPPPPPEPTAPQQQQYPPQQQQYPPQQQQYPPQQQQYPPQQQQYPPQQQQYPQQPYPPQQGYPPQQYPPQQYPPQQPGYPPQQYPPQQGYYPPPEGYPPLGPPPEVVENPFIFGVSGMLGLGLGGDTSGLIGAYTLDGFGQIGFRITPGFGLVGLADLNYTGDSNNGGLFQGMLGGGIRLGKRVGFTIGVAAADIDNGNVGYGGFALLGHLTLPFGQSALGFHAQTALAIYPNAYTLFTVSAGFGWGR